VCPMKKTGPHATTSLRLKLFRSSGKIRRVNNVANDDEQCAAPAQIIETQSSLFSTQ
jgi:hypothetical protein